MTVSQYTSTSPRPVVYTTVGKLSTVARNSSMQAGSLARATGPGNAGGAAGGYDLPGVSIGCAPFHGEGQRSTQRSRSHTAVGAGFGVSSGWQASRSGLAHSSTAQSSW